MRIEATRLAPNRNEDSDGICASASHSSQNSSSDHERGEATDLTHDPAGGWDTHARLEELRKKKDPRVKYIISNGRIANPKINNNAWRPYTGSNQHKKHGHVSFHSWARNDIRPFWSDTPIVVPPTPLPEPNLPREDEWMLGFMQSPTKGNCVFGGHRGSKGWFRISSEEEGPDGLRQVVRGSYIIEPAGKPADGPHPFQTSPGNHQMFEVEMHSFMQGNYLRVTAWSDGGKISVWAQDFPPREYPT